MHGKKPSRLLGWIGWAGLDAIGRLALLTGSTVIFSRLMSPRDFGLAALVLSLVTLAAVFVGSPFEEALTQRRGLRMAHLSAALGASWLVGAVLFALSLGAGHLLAEAYGEPEVRLLLPVAMASIFFSGHSDIITALARRLRRFNDVAYATLMGHVIGVGASLGLAVMGYGIWSLIAQRLLVVVARAIILQYRIGHVVMPTLSFRHVRELSRFAGFSFLARLTENVTYLAFNNLVQVFYGISVLGHVNMAMRLIEPIRGAIVATGHNLAFSYFARATRDQERLRMLADQVVSQSAFVTVPVFVGMAAIAPVLLPLVAGPGWDDAVGITMCLSLASAIAVPAGLIYTAFSANARPEYSLLSLIVGFAAVVAVLVGASSLGPISVGLSRIAGDVVRAAFAIGLPAVALDWSRRQRFRALAPAWTFSGAMGGVVAAAALFLPVSPLLVQLILLVSLGIAVYAALLALFGGGIFLTLAAHLHLPGFKGRR